MAIVLKDRVKETTVTTGTGTLTLTGAVAGYQSFDAIGSGSQTYYTIVDNENDTWEVGIGVYTSGGSRTLTRATILSSSNAGSAVSFAAGTKDVFVTYPAEKAIYEEENGDTIINGGPITVWGTGISATPTSFDSSVGQMFANINNFSQLYNQNKSSAQYASADFVAYNNLTTDGEQYYVDMGINSSGFNDTTTYPIFPQNSAYVYSAGVDGGTVGQNADLYIGTGTTNSDVVLFAGGLDKPSIVGAIKSADGAVVLYNGASALSTNSGEKLQVYGTAKITGAATFGSTVTLNANPSAALQAATKQYVDSAVSTGFVVHAPARAATTANLATVYSNGTAGVGATLTADTNREFTTLDGVTGWSLGQRVLVKNQTNTFENGIYTLTDAGSTGVSPWILTRATDFDTAGVGEIANNAYVYITAGTVNIGSSYILSQTAAITVGTTALPFDLFAQPVAYTVNAPLNLTGTTLSLTGIVDAVNGGTGYGSYTAGQMLYADTTTTLAPLSVGSQYQSLLSTGSAPVWGAVPLNQSAAVSGTLATTNGGTGLNSYVLGDIVYSSATNTLSALAGNTTTTKKFLTQTGAGSASAAPAWGTIDGADVSGNISGQAGSVANALTAGTYLTSGGTYNGAAARTFAVDATDANTASKVVARDASGNFSAGTITATLSGAATSATTATNVAGGAANKIVYNTSSGTTSFVDAPASSDTYLYWNGSAFAYGTVVSALTGTSNQISVSASSGSVTLSTPQSIGTSSSVQFGSFGVGTAASGTTGEIRATNNITAYYSDERLKTKIGDIEDPLAKVHEIKTMLYHANEVAVALGYDASIVEVGLSAQSVQRVQPEAVAPAPIDDKYLTVRYERLVPLLIEAIKALDAKVDALAKQIK